MESNVPRQAFAIDMFIIYNDSFNTSTSRTTNESKIDLDILENTKFD
jgi:hypothetical protein